MTVWSHRLPRSCEELVGVLARLLSHLRETTGLTIRATVSPPGLLGIPTSAASRWPGSLHNCPAFAVRSRRAPASAMPFGIRAVTSTLIEHYRFTTACRRRQDSTASSLAFKAASVLLFHPSHGQRFRLQEGNQVRQSINCWQSNCSAGGVR
jgi:hypothetical protein